MFLRQDLRGLMSADFSRFRAVREWIATSVARRMLAVRLTDDLKRCRKAMSLRNLSWTANSRPRSARPCKKENGQNA